jgi:hypothetical protein
MDTNESCINKTTGNPLAGPESGIVTFGGPTINPSVRYYENLANNMKPLVRFKDNGTHYMYIYNGTTISDSIVEIETINGGKDFFLIKIFRDHENRTVMIYYGYGWKGTYAAGKFFNSEIIQNRIYCDKSWLVVRWDDTNMDGFVNNPGEGDTYMVLDQG